VNKACTQVLGRYRSAIGNYVETIPVRLEPEAADAVRKWAKRKCISRSEALRGLIDLGLAAAHPMKRSPRAAAGASEMAGRQIGKLFDPGLPEQERQARKRRLIKGPKESLGICVATSLKLVKADLTTAAHFNARVDPRRRLVGD
jgi:hypothetical protein